MESYNEHKTFEFHYEVIKKGKKLLQEKKKKKEKKLKHLYSESNLE